MTDIKTREPYRPSIPDGMDGPVTGPGPQPYYAEIADATSEHADAPPPTYTAQTITNKHGKDVLRLRFESFGAMEAFFADELIGSDMMEGHASKVIGTTLLIWDRN